MNSLPLDQVLIGDCRQILPELPEESVDLIFADPPYNLQLRQELWRPNLTKVDAVDDEWDQFASFEAYDRFTLAWLQACRRVLKHSGTLWVIGSYHNIYRVGKILQDLGFWVLNDLVWIKGNPMPNFRGVRFTNAQETLIWVQKERGAPYTFNHHAMKALNEGLQMRSDWYLPICSGGERIRRDGKKVHSAQKPEALLYRVILSSSNPGDIILDPFFGTGTTGVVAKRLQRRWIGIEREQQYADIAHERICQTPQEDYPPEWFQTQNPRHKKRVPFGQLLENGFLQPGQTLYFGKTGSKKAHVLADGSIKYQSYRGSIHQVAKKIRQAPCNGWDLWYFQDPDTGERRSIDYLRQMFREQYLDGRE